MTKKQKKLLQRITAAAILFAAGMLLPLFAETSDYIIFALFGISYINYRLGYYLESFLQYPPGRSV